MISNFMNAIDIKAFKSITQYIQFVEKSNEAEIILGNYMTQLDILFHLLL